MGRGERGSLQWLGLTLKVKDNLEPTTPKRVLTPCLPEREEERAREGAEKGGGGTEMGAESMGAARAGA